MAILLEAHARLLVQGATGAVGRVFIEKTVAEFPGLIVAGVTPGRSGKHVGDAPIFGTVSEAVSHLGPIGISLLCVPASRFLQAAIEAIDAGIRTLVGYVEGVPLHDTMYVVAHARQCGATLIGPNSAGLMSPGIGLAGELTPLTNPTRPGRLGIVSKSGSVAIDAMELTVGLQGHSTIVCLGGDPLVGCSFSDVLRLFELDAETDAVLMIGEIGGDDETRAAEVIRGMSKPVIAYICGHAAPRGQVVGHAGAIIARGRDTAAAKSALLQDAGARVAETLPGVVPLLRQIAFGTTASC